MKRISPSPKSVLSLDIGHRRIGLAGCDPLGITVTPLLAIHRVSFEADLEQLKKLCLSRHVEGMVVGIPLDDKGNGTKQSDYCVNYARRFANALSLPLALVNEHSSTWEAKNKYKLIKDKSGQLDSAAAKIILEQWLEEGPELVHL